MHNKSGERPPQKTQQNMCVNGRATVPRKKTPTDPNFFVCFFKNNILNCFKFSTKKHSILNVKYELRHVFTFKQLSDHSF